MGHRTLLNGSVLILVLVEHTLGVLFKVTQGGIVSCLNPCFSGTYSRSSETLFLSTITRDVLILVLVEHTLGVWVTGWSVITFKMS